MLTKNEIKRIKQKAWYHSDLMARQKYRDGKRDKLRAEAKRYRSKKFPVEMKDGTIAYLTAKQRYKLKHPEKVSQHRKTYYQRHRLEQLIYNQLSHYMRRGNASKAIK